MIHRYVLRREWNAQARGQACYCDGEDHESPVCIFAYSCVHDCDPEEDYEI